MTFDSFEGAIEARAPNLRTATAVSSAMASRRRAASIAARIAPKAKAFMVSAIARRDPSRPCREHGVLRRRGRAGN